MLDNITASINLARAGQIKGLAVTSAKPSALAPDFPTVAETVHGFDVASFHGIGVRGGTAPEVVAIIERSVVAISREQFVRDRLAGIAAHTVGSSSAETRSSLARERVPWSKIIQEIGIRIE